MRLPIPPSQSHSHRGSTGSWSIFSHWASGWKSDLSDDISLASTICSSKLTADSTQNSSLDALPQFASHVQNVVCHIDGMDCTCCEGKLRRVMESLMGLSNVKIAFLNARLEFDLCPNTCTLADVVVTVRRKTGLVLTHVDLKHRVISVCLLENQVEWFLKSAIIRHEGTFGVQWLNKTTASITYDPKRIGIRDELWQAPGQRITVVPPPGIPGAKLKSQTLKRSSLYLALATTCTIPTAILSYGFTKWIETKAGATTCLTLASIVQLIAVVEFYSQALRSLIREFVFELDMLIVLSTSAAYLFPVVEFIFLMVGRPIAKTSSGLFATSSMLITFVLLGRLISEYTLKVAVQKVSVPPIQGETAALVTSGNARIETIDRALLQFEDCFKVDPSSPILTDGVVVQGHSDVDESMLTGESTPVLKTIGDEVTAGTLNGDGTLTVKLTRLPGRNSLTDITEQLAQANSIKPKIQNVADRVAQWFTPLVMSIAAVTFFVWLVIEVKMKRHTGWVAVGTAVTYPIAVLAVSCPCALVLAGPLVLAITGAMAAGTGVILRSPEAIEQSHRVTDVVFDKTGTLTLPDLTVVHEHPFRDPVFVSQLILALTNGVQHPLSRSLHRHLAQQVLPGHMDVQDITVVPGCGISGNLSGVEVKVGSADWLGYPLDDVKLVEDMSVACVTVASELVAVYELRARLRPEVKDLITTLKARGVAIHLLSGDRQVAVECCAKSLGIDMANVRHQCSPTEKQAYVHSLSIDTCSESACIETQAGHHHRRHNHHHHGPHHSCRTVMFIGDGTNDALARETAHIGVQVGKASDSLSSSASVTLLGSLTGIIDLLDLSKAAYRRIIFNLIWAAVYNLFAILLATGVAVKGSIPPRYAGLGELVSLLPVVLVGASITLVRRKNSPLAKEKEETSLAVSSCT